MTEQEIAAKVAAARAEMDRFEAYWFLALTDTRAALDAQQERIQQQAAEIERLRQEREAILKDMELWFWKLLPDTRTNPLAAGGAAMIQKIASELFNREIKPD